MKILYVTNNLSGTDGWSRYSLDLVSEMRKNGHNVLCVVSKKTPQSEISEIEILDTPLKYLLNPITSFLGSRKLSRVINQFKPDAIHFIVEPYANMLPFLRLKNIRSFLTVHGTYTFIPNLIKNKIKNKVAYYLTVRVYKKIDYVIAVSHFTKDYLLKNLTNDHRLQNKIKVITNGVDVINYNEINQVEKTNDVAKILFVGAIKSRKGLLESIEALKFYHNNFDHKFIFNVVGNYNDRDPYYLKLLAKIKEYNLTPFIFFRGRVSQQELGDYYKEADLFLMTSIASGYEFEGFGLVYLEANIKGVPCIGSLDCGAQDAIVNGKTGYLVDPRNAEDVAKKIDLILKDNLINHQDCINWARENSIENKTANIIQLYKTSLNIK